MWATFTCVLVADTILLTAGFRASSVAGVAQSAQTRYLKKSVRFCLADDAELKCDDEQSIMDIENGFYAEAWKTKCGDRLPKGDGVKCHVNATDELEKLCNGKNSCILPTSMHPHCNKYSMRVKWECLPGTPETAKEDREFVEQVEEDDKIKEGEIDRTPEKSMDEVKETVKKNKGHLHAPEEDIEAGFTTCYRFSRTDLVMRGEFFARLTGCRKNEGCFRLNWEDGREYTAEKERPSNRDIMEATLSHGDDSAVTWFGFGLERNPYHTWGVCLPKKGGVSFAMAVFDESKLDALHGSK